MIDNDIDRLVIRRNKLLEAISKAANEIKAIDGELIDAMVERQRAYNNNSLEEDIDSVEVDG